MTINGKVDITNLQRYAKEKTLILTYPKNCHDDKKEDVFKLDQENESVIVEIWAKVLNLNPQFIKKDVPFYQYGGDSVTMIIMIAKIIEKLFTKNQEKLFLNQLSKIIASPTINNLQTIITQLQKNNSVKN